MKSEIKLIDGVFTTGEARDIIGKLLEFKIQFHSKEDFSNEIRNGVQDDRSRKRKEELLQAKDDFMQRIGAIDPEKQFEIRADIHLIEK